MRNVILAHENRICDLLTRQLFFYISLNIFFDLLNRIYFRFFLHLKSLFFALLQKLLCHLIKLIQGMRHLRIELLGFLTADKTLQRSSRRTEGIIDGMQKDLLHGRQKLPCNRRLLLFSFHKRV